MTTDKTVVIGVSSQETEALHYLKELIETGRLTPVIDRCYPLEDVAKAHVYVEAGLKKGNVAITVTAEPPGHGIACTP